MIRTRFRTLSGRTGSSAPKGVSRILDGNLAAARWHGKREAGMSPRFRTRTRKTTASAPRQRGRRLAETEGFEPLRRLAAAMSRRPKMWPGWKPPFRSWRRHSKSRSNAIPPAEPARPAVEVCPERGNSGHFAGRTTLRHRSRQNSGNFHPCSDRQPAENRSGHAIRAHRPSDSPLRAAAEPKPVTSTNNKGTYRGNFAQNERPAGAPAPSKALGRSSLQNQWVEQNSG